MIMYFLGRLGLGGGGGGGGGVTKRFLTSSGNYVLKSDYLGHYFYEE